MDADRMFTVLCAKRDFGQRMSRDVFERFAKDEIVAAFRDRPLDAELGDVNLLHRVAEWRKLGKPGPEPSDRPIGKLTTEGRRAYLWLDDGSVYGEPLGRPVVWLFGARDIMLEGLDALNDADFYCYAADLGAQP